MSAYLKLFPLHKRYCRFIDDRLFCPHPGAILASTCLEVSQDYRIYAQISGIFEEYGQPIIKPVELPNSVCITVPWYYADKMADKNGNALTCVSVKMLLKIRLPDDVDCMVKAAFGYLMALPEDSAVILWWH